MCAVLSRQRRIQFPPWSKAEAEIGGRFAPRNKTSIGDFGMSAKCQ
jgi:hypothetical protein